MYDKLPKMKGRDRNKPCWCGSNKKYKKCHLDRDSQPQGSVWNAVDVNKKAFNKKRCFARGVGLGACEGDVIKAHTVSRGSNLAKIAKNGHVLHYTTSVTEMNKNGGKISIKEIGTKQASVFYGFCTKHDREIFSCVENTKFIGEANQCLAVAYRTMSRELYGKDAGAHLRETLRGADKGKHPSEQYYLQASLDTIDIGNEAARRDLKATHDVLTDALVKNQPDIIKSLIFEFAEPLPFMFAGAWSPFTDFYGEELQKGYSDEILEQVFVTSFIVDSTAMICFSWRNINDAPGMVIAEQIKALPSDKQASACFQVVMKHVENIFFNPDWFQRSLSEKERNVLYKLASDGLDFLELFPLCLLI